MNADTFNRLHELRQANDSARYAQQEMAPRFAVLAGRHENGTAPRAVVSYQLFQTPPDIAERMAKLACLKPGDRVLEPSAGLGRLLDAIAPYNPAEVVAVEMSADCAGELFRQYRPRVTIKQRDFLTLTRDYIGTFDAVTMNPPFHMRADIAHIRHALTFLRSGGKLVALCLDTPHRATALREMAESWEVLPPETFAKEGTRVQTTLLTITKP